MSLFGTSWEDPKTAAIMGLAGGLLQGNAGAGLQQGLLGYQRQAQINNQTARQQKYDAREDEEFALKKTEAQRKIDSDKLTRETLRQAAMELQAGTFKPEKYAGVLPAETLKNFIEMPNWGRQKVARTVKGMGPDGREYEYQVDDYGQRVGEGMAQFKAPLMQNLNDKVVALDPYTLKPQAQFAVGMSPGERAADARGWASNSLAKQRLAFDMSGGADGMGPNQAQLVKQFGKPEAGYRWRPDGVQEPLPGGKAEAEQLERKQSGQARAASMQAQLGVIDKALSHPGLNTSVGLSGTLDPRNYIPGTDASDFRAVLDQIGGTAFLQAFESLKGGGQITEVEGKKATDAIARLSRAQSDKEFRASLLDLREVMSKGVARLGPQAGPQAAPGAMGSGSFGATPTMRWNPQTRKLEPVGGR